MTLKIRGLGIILLLVSVIFFTISCKKNANNTEETAEVEEFSTIIEELLKEYEEIVDEYIIYLQATLHNGDMEAIMDMEAFQDRLFDWQEKMLEIPEEEITAEHLFRLEEISKKIDESL